LILSFNKFSTEDFCERIIFPKLLIAAHKYLFLKENTKQATDKKNGT
jgi:hypothetical protein